MGLTFGSDRVCHLCRGTGKGRALGIECSLCEGTGIEREKPPAPRLDLPHPTRPGEVLRDEGIRAVSEAEPRWMDTALSWVESLSPGSRLDALSLAEAVGRPDHENAVGAAFGIASRRRLIRPVGIVQSSRPQRHAGRILEWERVA